MKIHAAKKLGFFSSVCMLIGTVVGIGIFFKNHSILATNNWNGIGTLFAWIIGGILSLGAALSFSEISSFKTKNVHGLAAYSEIIVNKKFGYFIRFHYPFILGLFNIVMAFFTTETIVSIFSTLRGLPVSVVPIYGHVLIALGLLLFLHLMNYFSLRASGIFQQITTILKWIPLILVAFLGIIMANINNVKPIYIPKDYMKFGQNAFFNGQHFFFTSMLASLPAVLFAYDAFLNFTSITHKIKGGSKRIPLVVIVGMISIITLYTLIALSSILHGSGMVSGSPYGKYTFGWGIFDQIFNKNLASFFGKITIIFLAIAALGTTNGLCLVNQHVLFQCINTNTYFGIKTLKKKFSISKIFLIFMIGIFLFWTIVVYVPVIILNTDAYVDGISNFPSVFSFAMYAIIILFYTLKRKKYSTSKINGLLFKTFAWIAIIGILLLVSYQTIYNFFIQTLINHNWKTNWGLFLSSNQNQKMFGWEASIMFFSFITIYISFPVINYFLAHKFEKNNVCINTQK